MTRIMTKKEYDKLLESNERELWELTEAHYKLVDYVQANLWECVQAVKTEVEQARMADELYDLGCEVEA